MSITLDPKTTPSPSVPELRFTAGKARYLRFALPGFLLLVYFAQCVWFARTQSFTFDEPLHLTTGLHNWRFGRFDFVIDHPPLGHLLPTIPIAFGNWDIEWTGIATHITDPVRMAMRVRLVNIVLGVFLGLMLWWEARNIFSEGAANLVLALFAFSPSLIAHFSQVTTDGVATLTVFLTAMQLLRWRKNPSRWQALLLGVALGLLLLAKLSTPPVFILTLVLVLVLKPDGWEWSPRRWNWVPMLIAMFVAGFVLWAGYFFHVSRLSVADGHVEMTFPNGPTIAKDSLGRIFPLMRRPLQHHFTLFIPAGEYLEGIGNIVLYNRIGHSGFLMGRSSSAPGAWFQAGWALIKWPPIVLLIFLFALYLLISRKVRPKVDLLVLSLFPVSFVLFQMALSRISTGERHSLPVYPFVLLLCGAVWEFASGRSENPKAHRNRTLIFVLVLAVLLNAADVLRYAPGYLSYSNILIPEQQSYRYFSGSNLDWGQGLVAVRDYEQQHPNENISLAYFGSVDPADYGIHAARLLPGEKRSGTIVIGATDLSGEYLRDSNSYQWVTKYPLRTILDHCMYVFTVPANVDQGQVQK
jgi:4-amino-4-deoxy-L-arabinose transferase-like glycosyltransferase